MSRLTYALVLALLVGCSGVASDAARESTAPPVSPAPSPQPSAAALGPVAQRCGVPDASARRLHLDGPEGSQLAAVEVGSGPVGAVFVHETGDLGLCGFWPYAVWLNREYGLRSLLIDLCGYGRSHCMRGRFAGDYVAQTDLAVQWLRDSGVRRVTLVGASMGGAIAAVASARIEPEVDAVVDLSGPLEWGSLDVVDSAPEIHAPALFAVASYDTVVSVRELRAALQRTSGSQRFVETPVGHGWQLLGARDGEDGFSPEGLGRQVAQWIEHGPGAGS